MIYLSTHSARVEELFQLLNHKGRENYFSEPVTQLEHALQAAYFASEKTDRPHLIIAALLHDIGHLADSFSPETQPELGTVDHDYMGASYLKKLGFRKEVTSLVANHVKAKRYLVTTDPSYRANLSEASKQTLVLQGGSMWPFEIEQFESDPSFDEMIFIRICDEMAKVPGLVVPALEYYRSMLESYLDQSI